MLPATIFPRAAAMALGVLCSMPALAQTSGAFSSGDATAPSGTTPGISPTPGSLLSPAAPSFGSTTPSFGSMTVPNNRLAPLPGSPSPGFSTSSPSFSTPSPSFSTPSPSFSTPSPSFGTTTPSFSSSTPGATIQLQPPVSSTPDGQPFGGVRICPSGMTFC